MLELDHIYNMDCLEGMKQIPDGTIDAVICDLPYGTTACAWDSVIPFDKLWEQYKRICKPSAVILLFGSEPFSTMLRMSNMDWRRYDWIWLKNTTAGFVHAKNRPLKNYEIISAFCKFGMGHVSTMGDKRMPYNPQGLRPVHRISHNGIKEGQAMGVRPSQKETYIQEFENYPKAVLEFDSDINTWHPTQKPVDLLRYFVLTYTNMGGVILDNCMGSGSKKNHCNVCLPILSWTDEDVAEFIAERGIKCHPLYYDESGAFHPERRLGCIGCSLKSDAGRADFKSYPKLFRQVVKAVCVWWNNHPNSSSVKNFGSPYGLLAHNLFFKSYQDWQTVDNGLFGHMDWKSALEKYFGIKL